MYENITLINSLINLKSLLKDDVDLNLINDLIIKYNNIPFSVNIEYTDRELKGSMYVFNNILKSFYEEPECWDMPDPNDTTTWSCNNELFDKVEFLSIELDKIITKYSLLRIKNIKSKNILSRQNSILIQNCFVEECKTLINKTLNYETSKH